MSKNVQLLVLFTDGLPIFVKPNQGNSALQYSTNEMA